MTTTKLDRLANLELRLATAENAMRAATGHSAMASRMNAVAMLRRAVRNMRAAN